MLFVCLLLFSFLPMSTSNMLDKNFFMSKFKQPTLAKYNGAFQIRSKIQCGLLCDCQMFYYKSKMCFVLDPWNKTGDAITITELYIKPNIIEVYCSGPGYHLIQPEGICVWVSTDYKTWQAAEQQCEDNGWTLLQMKPIHLKKKHAFIKSVGSGYYWLGGNDIETEGEWKWSDGESISQNDMTSKWGYDQPNNYRNQDCLYMNGNYQWNDNSCNEKHRFLCEFDFNLLF